MSRVGKSILMALLALLAVGAGQWPAAKADGPASRVNAPYFADDVVFSEAAVFWLGRVTPTTNYADVRVGYNDEELWVHVQVFDRRLWYNPAPSADTLAAWDAATLLISPDGPVGSTVDSSDFRFTGQLTWWERSRAQWQAAWDGSTAGWKPAARPFTTAGNWRGDEPNNDVDDAGWSVTFEIPFESLGLAGKPARGTAWGFAVLVHDRDDNAGTPIPAEKWPANMLPESPGTWAQLAFGRPAYVPTPAAPLAAVMIRQGLGSAVVPDAVVGGNTTCGDGVDRWTDWGNKNYGGVSYFNVQNQVDISDFPCFSKYFVTFPLDALPAGRVVISAVLQLHEFGNAGAGWSPAPKPSYIQVLTVAEDWDEATLTWNNAPAAEQNIAGTWVDPLGDPVPPRGSDKQWDVSAAVAQAYAAGRPLHLAVYSGDGEYHSGRYFRSSDFGDAPERPALIVRLGDPGGSTHPAWLPYLCH